MKKEWATFTNMCMITKNNQVLLQKRKDPNWPGVVFPGGHVHKEESFTDSVIREVKEETGLTIKNPVLCGVKQFTTKKDGRYVVFLFKATSFTGSLSSSQEGEVFWPENEALSTYSLAEGFEEMLPVFIQQYNELYYVQKNGRFHCELK